MPDYDLRCTAEPCRHAFGAYHHVSQSHPPCPKCGAATDTDWNRATAPRVGNRTFTDTLSRSFGFHPDEVAEVRAMMGEEGNCIDDEGDVHFQDRAQERRFREKYIAVRASNQARVAEQEEALAADPEEQDARGVYREMRIADGLDPDEIDESMLIGPPAAAQ